MCRFIHTSQALDFYFLSFISIILKRRIKELKAFPSSNCPLAGCVGVFTSFTNYGAFIV